MTFLSLQGTNSFRKRQSFSCNAEHGPDYPTRTENLGTWWSQTVVPTKSSSYFNTNKSLMLIITIFSSTYFTASYFSFSERWVQRQTCCRCEAEIISVIVMLLSMNSLQSLGSYCSTSSLSRSSAISVQNIKSFTVKKKMEVLLMPVVEEADASTVREEFFFSFNQDTNSSAEPVDKLRSWTRSFNSFGENGCGTSS